MPEERGLYPKMPVGGQLEYFAQLHGLDPAESAANAARWMERLGVAERAEDPVEELSLGNQQRVQLAAALVHGPDLLVLDEPFSGLDPVGVEVLAEVLLAESRERELPVIFSSHQLDLVERLCDSVAIIKEGRLVASGEVESLREERARNHWEIDVEGVDDAEFASILNPRPLPTGETVVLVLVYFLLGYALYACAFAVAGAIVSRQEDVGSVTTPLTILLVVGTSRRSRSAMTRAGRWPPSAPTCRRSLP